MLAMDLPPDLDAVEQQILVAQAQSDASNRRNITFGVCTLAENPVDPVAPYGAVLAPDMSVTNYYRNILGMDVNYKGTSADIIEGPKHGIVENINGTFAYRANNDYLGDDSVVFEMDIEGDRIKIIHFIKVEKLVSGDMYEDKDFCPKGTVWKIALDTGAISKMYLADTSSLEYESSLPGSSNPKPDSVIWETDYSEGNTTALINSTTILSSTAATSTSTRV